MNNPQGNGITSAHMSDMEERMNAVGIVFEAPTKKIRYNIWRVDIGNLPRQKAREWVKQSKQVTMISILVDSDCTKFITPRDLFVPSNRSDVEEIALDPKNEILYISVGCGMMTKKRAEIYMKEMAQEFRSEDDDALGIRKVYEFNETDYIEVKKVKRSGIIDE